MANLCKPAHVMMVCLGLSLAMAGCYGPDGAADPGTRPTGAASGALSQRLVCRAGVCRAPGDAVDLCAAFPARALSEMDAAAGRRSSAIGVRVVTLGAAMSAQSGPYLQALAQSGDGSGTAAYASASTVTTTLDSGWKISFGPFEIHENMTVTTVETVDDEDDAEYTEVCDEDGNCTCE